jgi:hypothetical protein
MQRHFPVFHMNADWFELSTFLGVFLESSPVVLLSLAAFRILCILPSIITHFNPKISGPTKPGHITAFVPNASQKEIFRGAKKKKMQ